jgi:flagellar motor switch protein FliN/FliY
MKSYLDCWTGAATALFSQALTGEPELAESLPKPLAPDSFGYVANITGDLAGRFAVVLDATVLDAPLVGEGMDQKAGWGELLREVAESAVGELLAATGKKCRIESFEATPGEAKISRAFQLKSGDKAWTILVRDEVRAPLAVKTEAAKAEPAKAEAEPVPTDPARGAHPPAPTGISPGIELLLDIELDAALRFGCREMPLGEILDLGPGDVVQLDRHIADPVDLIVGDKIVARGEVVLVNGNFGLRITEVAAPRKRLESIRCLF